LFTLWRYAAAAGVKKILYTSPPLNAMHCLSSMQARVLFAQAQNSVGL
jgi:hypothetical protein